MEFFCSHPIEIKMCFGIAKPLHCRSTTKIGLGFQNIWNGFRVPPVPKPHI